MLNKPVSPYLNKYSYYKNKINALTSDLTNKGINFNVLKPIVYFVIFKNQVFFLTLYNRAVPNICRR